MLIDPFSKNMLSACRAAWSLRNNGTTTAFSNDIDMWSPLRRNRGENAGEVPFLYSTSNNTTSYDSVQLQIIDTKHPAYVFFAPLRPSTEAFLRKALLNEFQRLIQPNFLIVKKSTGRTLRVTLALVDVYPNIPILSTLARIEPICFLLNIYNTCNGNAGLLLGSITYWVEVIDVDTEELLLAYVGKGYPHPLDIAASLRLFGAAKAGTNSAARMFMDLIRPFSVASGAGEYRSGASSGSGDMP